MDKIKFFFLIILLINYIYLETSGLQIVKLPYLSINKNIYSDLGNSSLYLRKLSNYSNIYGSAAGLNYYYANLYLGELMIKQSYILDTGSSVTTSPCMPFCEHCGKHLNSYFYLDNEKKVISKDDSLCDIVRTSNSNSDKRCLFEARYSEGSAISGFYYKEIIRFGENYKNKPGKKCVLGCTTKEDNLFYTQQADGIMGLVNSDDNFPSILKRMKLIKFNIFTICLSQKGGYFSIGEIDTKYHKSKINYMSIDKHNYFYETKINKITILNENINSIQKENFGSIIDSGTTLTYFPKTVFDEAIYKIKAYCKNLEKKHKKNVCGKYKLSNELGPCFGFANYRELDEAIENYWPSISFYLKDDILIKWVPKNYAFNNSNENTGDIEACLGFSTMNGNRFTLGSTWMIGYDIIFDREKRIRIQRNS